MPNFTFLIVLQQIMERNNSGFPNFCWLATSWKEEMTMKGQQLTGKIEVQAP